MSCPDFRSILTQFDINLFQETHLRPGVHDAVQLPDGYTIFSQTRKPRSSFNSSWGGIAAIVSQALPLSHRIDLLGPDFMVLQLDNTLIYNVYLLPETANWALSELASDPCEALVSSLALARSARFNIVMVGDFNARTASLRAWPLDPPRVSSDQGTVSTRGRWLLKVLAEHDLVLLNGMTTKFGEPSAKSTSFQGARKTVIDYAMATRNIYPMVTTFSVCDREDGYDHAALVLAISMDVSRITRQPISFRKKNNEPLPSDTILDKLLIATIEAEKDDKKKMLELYGTVHVQTNVIKAATYGVLTGSLQNLAAGAGVYWGPNNSKNASRRVAHAKPTGARADLEVMYLALLTAPRGASLEILTRSEYAVRSIKYYALKNAALGWICLNGDILKHILECINRRWAPLTLTLVKKDTKNKHLDSAKQLALAGAILPPTLQPRVLHPHPSHDLPVLDCEKVVTCLRDGPHGQAMPDFEQSNHENEHRGRSKLRAIKNLNREKVMSARAPGAFWKEIKRLADPRPLPISVSAESLRAVFEVRLNPPVLLPLSFSGPQHKINQLIADLMPPVTVDPSPEGFFTSQWTEGDIAAVKAHLQKHSTNSSSGEDKLGYKDIMEIPNADLAFLCNECVCLQSCPSVWFRSTIIGILKHGKTPTEPSNYRIIALESCILKMLTLLIHKRITGWAERYGHLPETQNGFREGRRTNDNPFVLRCAWETTKAEGQSLYVAAVDATNAFPSTDHPTLWLKLFRMGMGGSLFDWLRMLYREMEYSVRHGGWNSEVFKALIGLLTGDPASPTLWNLFMSDLVMPDDSDDVVLAATRIPYVAQADDILIISRTAAGLQRKLNVLQNWCSRNFILVNMIKTIVLIFGRVPSVQPSFFIGENRLTVKTTEKYVGITIRTDTRNPFQDHYTEKAGTARYCGHRIMAIEDQTGSLTPKELKQLYMARVDCHLIQGCELSPDVDDVHIEKLTAVQVSFIRRMLNLHRRSMIAPLYTETGLVPLRIRCLVLTLRYLQYLLALPET